MQNFTFQNCTRIIFGDEALSKINEELKPFGKKVLLTFGKGSVKATGLYDQILKQLKDYELQEFWGIEPNPRVETLREAVTLGKNFQPDIILAVGGGSVIDGSKLIAAAINFGGDPWELVLDNTKIGKCVPLASVLTVSATGTEMNAGAVITNWKENLKLAFHHDDVMPRVSFLDPQNTFSLTAEQTAYGIVDIFSHVLEQYLTNGKDIPLQDRWAEGILLTLIENAPLVLKDLQNYSARANIMLASTMALNGLISMGTPQDWATHNIEHELSAFYDIPHGLGLAIVTPRWMKAVIKEKQSKIAQLGRRVFDLRGEDKDVAEKTIKAVGDFFQSLGIKMDLSALKIDATHFPIMIERLSEKGIGETPLKQEQITMILTECLKKYE